MSNLEPIGKQLQAARDAQCLSIQDVEAILKIKPLVIQMIEQDLYPTQNIDVFTKGQIISYCKLLNLNPQTIINCLEAKGYDFPVAQNKDMQSKSVQEPKRKTPWLILGSITLLLLFNSFSSSRQHTTTKPAFTQPLKIESHYDN